MRGLEKEVSENKPARNLDDTCGFATSIIISGAFLLKYMEDYVSKGIGTIMIVTGICSYYLGRK